MCSFFSFLSDGQGTFYYLNDEQRRQLAPEEPDFEPDSHTSIAAYYSKDEDRLNKYEYDPITQSFEVDNLSSWVPSDTGVAERWARSLDFNTIDHVRFTEVKRVLDHIALGGKVRMRTKKEFIELLGPHWRRRLTLNWPEGMDYMFGLPVTPTSNLYEKCYVSTSEGIELPSYPSNEGHGHWGLSLEMMTILDQPDDETDGKAAQDV